ncbi:tumor necrosis factor ligand superfamily member 14 [Melanotaenia boesemani]|uniref:tumor necrosis factor ligand superfamily member 14 n=1 Tax=Melanotaenia boesemani TaxID=1250792 RepID=UPI001C05D1B2|nr:tumor necrosis factor ligand superfamily member 14 [Melanotaenia boesemani]
MFSKSPNNTQYASEGGYPSVYVVDTHATQHPIPPRLKPRRRSIGPAQTTLFLLVSLALCGMAVEACLIYRLYKAESANEASLSSMLIASDVSPTKRPSRNVLPSKPVAHLTDGPDATHSKHVLAWSIVADPLLHEMSYKNRNLIILEEGYYYVYSKILFSDRGLFHHFVNLHTERFAGEYLTLLQSRKISPALSITQSNSYLGGVFHLYKNDALYVNVSNTAKIVRSDPSENIFGAYMI